MLYYIRSGRAPASSCNEKLKVIASMNKQIKGGTRTGCRKEEPNQPFLDCL
uniref:Uncharacterized protein n=1 Tax=Triticum urartu TaxID=4572 RepID=A0A8R7PMR0_TRIUA